VAVAGSGEVAEFAGAVGKGGEHGVAVGDGFVAGEFEGAGEGFCGVDGFGFHLQFDFSMSEICGAVADGRDNR